MSTTQDEDVDPASLLISEEIATVTKKEVRTGRVQVRTFTDTIEEIVRSSVQSETVDVTRVRIDRQVDTAPTTRTEGDVTIIPVLEEVLIIEKRLFLREEIHIRKTATTETVETPVTLRRQRAAVDHQDG